MNKKEIIDNWTDELNAANFLAKDHMEKAVEAEARAYTLRRCISDLETMFVTKIETKPIKTSVNENEIGNIVTCVFCQEPCQPAPTDRGWASAGSFDKGLHFDCARKVASIGLAISEQNPERSVATDDDSSTTAGKQNKK